MKQRTVSIFLTGALVAGTGASGANRTQYPINRTIPTPLAVAPENRLTLFMKVGETLSLVTRQPTFIASVHMVQDADDNDTTVCGSALLGAGRRPTVFVLTAKHHFIDVTDEGFKRLGCTTAGGLFLTWKPREDGSEGMEIR